mmetsp:Transcript_1291/g.810  ORF Transcript_1291/g.810 Transcript_1291/m.810 type:complete len:113 (+) Transcript_1291:2-340(+)
MSKFQPAATLGPSTLLSSINFEATGMNSTDPSAMKSVDVPALHNLFKDYRSAAKDKKRAHSNMDYSALKSDKKCGLSSSLQNQDVVIPGYGLKQSMAESLKPFLQMRNVVVQ